MEIEIANKHVLFLPEWYPNPDDVQLAIFVEKFARSVSKHLKVSLIFCGPFAKSNEIELVHSKKDGINSYFCYYPKQKNKLKAYNYFFKAHEMCFAKLKDDGLPDLVHLHMLFRNYLVYKKLYSKISPKYLITEQWSGYLNGTYQKLSLLKKSYYKKAFKHAYFVTAVSKKLAQALNEHFEIQNNIIILPNIAEKDNSTIHKSTNEFNLLVVADLVDEIKNISGVIQAYINSNLQKKSTLTIIGGGHDEIKLKELALKLNSSTKQIVFLGQLDNPSVLKAMKQNHVLITNSRHETFSMVTAEALLAGLPVICTKCGGPQEFVDESNGKLINIDDKAGLINAIEQMQNDYTYYDVSALAVNVLNKFGIEKVGQDLKIIYSRILS